MMNSNLNLNTLPECKFLSDGKQCTADPVY